MVKYIPLTCLVGGVLLFAQPTQVPAALFSAAQNSPVEFVMAVADASVPAGLELRSSELFPRRKPEFDLKSEPTRPAAELVQVFNAYHGDYGAAIVDDVLVVRPTGRRSAYLDQPSTLEPVTVTGLRTALRRVFSDLDPSVGATGGIAGSSINLGPEEAGDYMVVPLDGRGRKVIDVLNDIAKRSRRAWFVAISNDDQSPRVIEFGLVHHGGSITRVRVP